MSTRNPRKALNLGQAVRVCLDTAPNILRQQVIAPQDEKRLVEASKLVLQKDDSVYGRYLRQVERVCDRQLVSVVALALGKSALRYVRNADKNQLPSEMKGHGYASEALTALVHVNFDVDLHVQPPKHHTPAASEPEGAPEEGRASPVKDIQGPTESETPAATSERECVPQLVQCGRLAEVNRRVDLSCKLAHIWSSY